MKYLFLLFLSIGGCGYSVDEPDTYKFTITHKGEDLTFRFKPGVCHDGQPIIDNSGNFKVRIDCQ